jgi:hypothetical protein
MGRAQTCHRSIKDLSNSVDIGAGFAMVQLGKFEQLLNRY